MATYTTTSGAALGNIPLSTLMVDKDAVVSIVSGSASGVVDTVSGMISSAISTVWKAGGSVAASGSGALVYKSGTTWTAPLLVSGNEGKVYHLSEDYDITSDTAGFFKEGSGTHIEAGTDVAVIAHPTVQGGYIYDVLAVTDSSVVKSINNSWTPTNGNVTIPTAVASGQTGATDGLMSSGDKHKLNNIAAGAEVNQNAFSKIAVSGVTGTGDASSKTDTLTLVPGSNVTMTRDGKSVTINATGAPESSGFAHVTIGSVTIDADSAADTLTISGTTPIVASGDATNDKVTISHATCGPSSTGNTSKGDTTNQTPVFGGTFKVTSATVDKYGHTTALAEHTVTIPNSTVVASTSGSGGSAGLMSATDKEKLNCISTGANVGIAQIQATDGGTAGVSSSGAIVVFSGSNITITASPGAGADVVNFSVPSASTSGEGVVLLASSISAVGTVVPTAEQVVAAISGVESGLSANIATRVSGGSLHTALSGSGLANGVGSGNNTIYALINALHSVDGTAEA